MRGALAVVMALALAVPAGAMASEPVYPRVVTRGGQVCIQDRADDGTVTEKCRYAGADWTGAEQVRPAGPETSEPIAPPRAAPVLDLRYRPELAATPEQLRAVADASVAYGWSGALKLAGLTSLVGTAVAAGIVASEDGDPGPVLLAALPGVIFLTIGLAVDAGARSTLREAGVPTTTADGRSERERLRDHFRR